MYYTQCNIKTFRALLKWFHTGTWIHLKSVLYSRRWDLYSSKIGIFCLFLSHLFNPCSVSSFLFFLGHGPILQSFYKIGAIFKHILKLWKNILMKKTFQDPISLSICMFYNNKRNIKRGWSKIKKSQVQTVPGFNETDFTNVVVLHFSIHTIP